MFLQLQAWLHMWDWFVHFQLPRSLVCPVPSKGSVVAPLGGAVMMLLLPLPLLLELRACTLAEQRAFYGSVPGHF